MVVESDRHLCCAYFMYGVASVFGNDPTNNISNDKFEMLIVVWDDVKLFSFSSMFGPTDK